MATKSPAKGNDERVTTKIRLQCYSAHAPLNRDNGGILPDTYLYIDNKNKRSYVSDCWLPGTFSFPAISGGQWPPLLLQVIYY